MTPAPLPADLQIPDPQQVLQMFDSAVNDLNMLRQVMGYPGKDGRPESGVVGHLPSRAVTDIQYDDFPNMPLGRIVQGAIAGNKPIDANGVDTYRLAWQKAGDTLTGLYETFDRAIAKAIPAKWQGESGTAATAGIGGYVQQALNLVEGTYSTAGYVQGLRDAMATTASKVAGLQQGLTQVQAKVEASGMNSLVPGFTADVMAKATAEVQRDGQQVMSGTYRPGVQTAYTSMPALPETQSPVTGSTTDSGLISQGGTISGGGSLSAGIPLVNAHGTGPGQQQPAPKSQVAGAPGVTQHGSGAGNSQGGGAGTGLQQPQTAVTQANSGAQTQAADYDPTNMIGSGANVGQFGNVGGSSGLGVGDGGGEGFAGGGAGNGPLGSPTLGGSPAPTADAGAGVRAPTSSGRAGVPGTGAPSGGGAKREQDKEHKTARYLYSQTNGEKLIGVDGVTVGPAVFGVWNEAEPEHDERTIEPAPATGQRPRSVVFEWNADGSVQPEDA